MVCILLVAVQEGGHDCFAGDDDAYDCDDFCFGCCGRDSLDFFADDVSGYAASGGAEGQGFGGFVERHRRFDEGFCWAPVDNGGPKLGTLP